MKQNNRASRSELLGYTLGGAGRNLLGLFAGQFIAIFYTQALTLDLSATFVLRIAVAVLVVLLLPAIGIGAGRGRRLRFRFWLVWMSVAAAAALILSFLLPGLGGGYVAIAFTAVAMVIAFTGMDVTYSSLPMSMTSSSWERTKLFTLGHLGDGLAGLVSVVLGMYLLPVLIQGGNTYAWILAALVVGALGLGLCLAGYALVRERIPQTAPKYSLKQAAKNTFTNRPLLCVLAAVLLVNLALAAKGALNYYYCTYSLGSMEAISSLSAATTICLLAGPLLALPFAKLFGKRATLLGAAALNLACGAALFLADSGNLSFVIFMTALQVLPSGAGLLLLTSMAADTVEYGQRKTGQRDEGLVTEKKHAELTADLNTDLPTN